MSYPSKPPRTPKTPSGPEKIDLFFGRFRFPTENLDFGLLKTPKNTPKPGVFKNLLKTAVFKGSQDSPKTPGLEVLLEGSQDVRTPVWRGPREG